MVKEEKIFDFVTIVLFFALLLGRLVYVLEHMSDFQGFFDRFLHVYKYPGFNFWGLMLGGFAAAIVFLTKMRLAKLKILDYFAVSLSLFLSFVFLGYLFSGFYVGSASGLFGVPFVGFVGRRLPIQILAIVVFFIFFLLYKRKIEKKMFVSMPREEYGFIFWLFILMFFLLLLGLEFLRRDTLYFEPTAFNKFLYFVFFLFAAVIIVSKYYKFIKEKFKR